MLHMPPNIFLRLILKAPLGYIAPRKAPSVFFLTLQTSQTASKPYTSEKEERAPESDSVVLPSVSAEMPSMTTGLHSMLSQ